MCGFLGISGKNPIAYHKDIFADALQQLRHRGPDGEGIYQDDRVWLGHKRLSIIDLTPAANQPLRSHNQNSYIIYNGEVYNYKELSQGLTLKTQSDTEVLLEGFLKHQKNFLTKIRGMYAFVIYDANNAKLFLYRDPAGIKPLYYFHDDTRHELIFGSELKAILPFLPSVELNEQILKLYLHLNYCLEPQTIYKNVFALEPGTLLEWDISTGAVKKEKIFPYHFGKRNGFSFKENANETKKLLLNACQRNTVADVDVNVALSGGIDSSLVLAYTSKFRNVSCITVKFDEKEYDESVAARLFAETLHAPHTVINTNVDQKLESLNRLLLHFDQPFSDSSLLPFYLLTREAVRHSKVLIGGDSGDEIQNGYEGFKILPALLRLNQTKLKGASVFMLDVLLRFLPGTLHREFRKLRNIIAAENLSEAILEWHAWFPVNKNNYPVYPFKYDTKEIATSFTDNPHQTIESFIEDTYFTKRMLSDYLRKADMMSMINSVEFRVPMLDEDLVSLSLSIPYGQKSTVFEQKKIFKSLHRKVYPGSTSKLKKMGFSIPLDTWLGHENLLLMKEYLKKPKGIVTQYIDGSYIDVLFSTVLNTGDKSNRKYCSRASAYQRIFSLYSLQLWYLEKYNKLKR